MDFAYNLSAPSDMNSVNFEAVGLFLWLHFSKVNMEYLPGFFFGDSNSYFFHLIIIIWRTFTHIQASYHPTNTKANLIRMSLKPLIN